MKSTSKIIVLSLLFHAVAAYASAPMQTSGNPGYYRFKLGEFEVNTISDGTADLPMGKLLTNVTPKEIKADFTKNFLADKETVETSVDTFLINTGTKLVLIDTGTGGGMGPTAGHFLEHLKAAGYKPDQIDAVVITHMHGDHVGGLAKDGKAVFPKAMLYIGKEDVDFWTNKENGEKATGMMKSMFETAALAVAPYVKAKMLTPMTEDMEIVPGVRARMAHGHTPGHTIYVVESGGKKLMLLGDMIHVASVQFENPSATLQFDSDQKAAQMQRKTVFAEAAKDGDLVGAAHLPFPGIGHLRTEKKGYAFVPLNYNR